MKTLTLTLLGLLLSLTAGADTGAAADSALGVDSIRLYGNQVAQLTQKIDLSVHNRAAADFEGRLYLTALNLDDDRLSPCLDTLVSVKAGSSRQLLLYTVLPQGRLQLRLSTDAGGRECVGTYDVTVQPLRKLDMKATFSLDMLSREGVFYGSRIKGWARVENLDGDYFGARGGKGERDGIVVWLEDRDSGERLFSKHVASTLPSHRSAETAFAYDGVFRSGGRYALKAGYGMPYGLEPIDSLCFTASAATGTVTYWTAQGEVVELLPEGAGSPASPPVSDDKITLPIPAEAVAIDLRGLKVPSVEESSVAFDASRANPNCIYYLDADCDQMPGLDNSLNLVRGLEAEHISLTEGHDFYCPMAFRAKFVSYLMTPSYADPADEAVGRGYSETIVLPFRPTHVNLYDVNSDTEALHADMLKVLRYYGYDADTLTVAVLNSLSEMEAYQPYILGVYVGSRLLFTGVDTSVPMTGEAIVRGGAVDFVGTTVSRRLSPDYYVYSPADYSFLQVGAADVMAPFRACLYAADKKPHTNLDISRSVWGDKGKPGDATAIEPVTRAPMADSPAVCDLAGRRLASDQWAPRGGRLPKGIYISGGRKIVVK